MGVCQFLGSDHRRLDAMLRDAGRLTNAGFFSEALETFGDFRHGLERHIDMEERVLFPAFESATGMAHGPTAVMRLEHQEIRRLLDALAASLEAADPAGFREGHLDLVDVLDDHDAKEEHVLYPTVDRVLHCDRERDDLVQRMQRL
jgi:hemerythrin-like domain-containing protein